VTAPPLLHISSTIGRVEPNPGEAFVHLSRPHQVLTPANLLYAGERKLVLLVLDEARCAPDITVEGGFPHLYRPIEEDDIVDVVGFPSDEDGRFRLALAPVRGDVSPAAELLEAMVLDLEPLYGRIDGEGTPSAGPDDLWRPHGQLLVGFDESGEPVCCGGVKRLTDDTAEIKRMFVVPRARHRGHARRLLVGLEDAARRRGYAKVRLDTGPKQPQARAQYERAGYVSIADYNGNPMASFWGEKLLT
jgi:uncharacterized protein (DUF952 family)/GNAT superfamily N-acetyltransferase